MGGAIVLAVVAYIVYRCATDKKPLGPRFSTGDIEFHAGEYKRHVEHAYRMLHAMMLDKRLGLLLKDGGGKVVAELARAHYTYLSNVTSWVDDEFIPNFKKFRHPRTSIESDSTVHFKRTTYDHGDRDYKGDAWSSIVAAREHAKVVEDAISYFLCDTRSSFDMPKSFPSESPMDRTRWYVDGLNIAVRNFERIDKSFNMAIEFAKSNGK